MEHYICANTQIIINYQFKHIQPRYIHIDKPNNIFNYSTSVFKKQQQIKLQYMSINNINNISNYSTSLLIKQTICSTTVHHL